MFCFWQESAGKVTLVNSSIRATCTATPKMRQRFCLSSFLCKMRWLGFRMCTPIYWKSNFNGSIPTGVSKEEDSIWCRYFFYPPLFKFAENCWFSFQKCHKRFCLDSQGPGNILVRNLLASVTGYVTVSSTRPYRTLCWWRSRSNMILLMES